MKSSRPSVQRSIGGTTKFSKRDIKGNRLCRRSSTDLQKDRKWMIPFGGLVLEGEVWVRVIEMYKGGEIYYKDIE